MGEKEVGERLSMSRDGGSLFVCSLLGQGWCLGPQSLGGPIGAWSGVRSLFGFGKSCCCLSLSHGHAQMLYSLQHQRPQLIQ